MKVFESLTEALRQGYQVYTRVPEGYLVRTRVRDRWALALVVLRQAWREDDRWDRGGPSGIPLA
jgi:hypothetical protein